MPRLATGAASSTRAHLLRLTHGEVLQQAEEASGLTDAQYVHLLQLVARPDGERPSKVLLPGEKLQRPLDNILLSSVKRHGEAMCHSITVPPLKPKGSVGQQRQESRGRGPAPPTQAARPDSRGRGPAPPTRRLQETPPPEPVAAEPSKSAGNPQKNSRDEHRRQVKALAS